VCAMFNNGLRLDRRTFVRATAGACFTDVVRSVFAEAHLKGPSALAAPPIGIVLWLKAGQSIGAALQGARSMGFQTCQIGFEQLTAQVSLPLKEALANSQLTATALSEHGPVRRVFNFYDGPNTIGIVPRATRSARIINLKLAAKVASECGIPAIHTHCGFIPEDPNDPLYGETVKAVKEVATYCQQRGRMFLCETGEETPTTLLRMIQDVALDNVFVNLDVANLIMYGKGNPVDAMDVIGKRVRGIHAKDALFPTDTRTLGREVPIGEGKVDFAAVFERLKDVNYKGPITIERETEGAGQREDILRSKVFLQNLIARTWSE